MHPPPEPPDVDRLGPSIWRELRRQVETSGPALALVVVAIVVAAGALALLQTADDLTLSALTRDPAASYDFSELAGFLSVVGLLFWSAAVAMCFLARALTDRVAMKTFFLGFGALTALLVIDDAFLLHEELVPDLLPIRGAEKLFLLGLGVLALLVLWRNRAAVLESDYLVLGLALGLFAFSVFADVALPQSTSPGEPHELVVLVEDLAKFGGIVGWCAYLWRTSVAALR